MYVCMYVCMTYVCMYQIDTYLPEHAQNQVGNIVSPMYVGHTGGYVRQGIEGTLFRHLLIGYCLSHIHTYIHTYYLTHTIQIFTYIHISLNFRMPPPEATSPGTKSHSQKNPWQRRENFEKQYCFHVNKFSKSVSESEL